MLAEIHFIDTLVHIETWIHNACRLRRKRQLVAFAIIVICGFWLVYAPRDYWTDFIHGPFEIGSDGLGAISDPQAGPHQFYAVNGDKVVDTGVQEITTESRNGIKESSRVSAEWYVLVQGQRLLLVKSSTVPLTRIQGELSSIPSDVYTQLFSDPDVAGLRPRFYPFYLSREDDFRQSGYLGIGIGTIVLAAVCFFSFRAWRELRDISRSPVIRRVESWLDPIGEAAEAEREARLAFRSRGAGVTVTENYVLIQKFFSFNVFRFNDLLWAYKKVTRKSINFIPTGKEYDAVFVFYGGSQSLKGKEPGVEAALEFAATRSPWAIFGYSADLEKYFRKSPAEFCAAVEVRRQQATPFAQRSR